jgi:superfamily II DNA or RNA helicase
VPDLAGVKVARGDYVEDQLAEVMDDAKLIGNLVEHYKKYAEHRKAIIFAVNVAHSVHLAKAFTAAGIPAAHIDGKTELDERKEIISDYVNGKYKILSNCEVFTEGFDAPATDAIVLARPTKSLRMYLQMVGRGLRPKEDGGDCLILDHAGNVLRHGPADEEHEWSLDERVTIEARDREAKDDEEEEKKEREFICENCGHIFKNQPLCPKCGTPLPKFAKDMDTARGELVQLPGTKPTKKKVSQQEKQLWYSYFITYGREKGYSDGWAKHKFKEKFGVWPNKMERRYFVGSQYPVEFTNYIKYLNIKYAKSKHARRAN